MNMTLGELAVRFGCELRGDPAAIVDSVAAMSEMLKLIKDNPGHPSAPKWVQELRMLVQAAAPAQASEGLTKSGT